MTGVGVEYLRFLTTGGHTIGLDPKALPFKHDTTKFTREIANKNLLHEANKFIHKIRFDRYVYLCAVSIDRCPCTAI